MNKSEYKLLEEFLYEAIFQREGESPLPKSIIKEPDLKIYIEDFGHKDDYCLCAEVNKKIVGAVWTRIIKGYGNVDKDTPELAISLYKEFRGKGIGTELMKNMLNFLKNKKYKKVSLAVQKDNYAFKMYEKAGFKIADENSEEYIMEYYF